jgi:hypothetical protein
VFIGQNSASLCEVAEEPSLLILLLLLLLLPILIISQAPDGAFTCVVVGVGCTTGKPGIPRRSLGSE